MSQPFLDLSNVCPVIEGIGGGRGSEGVRSEPRPFDPDLLSVMLHHTPIDQSRHGKIFLEVGSIAERSVSVAGYPNFSNSCVEAAAQQDAVQRLSVKRPVRII